MLRLIVLFVFLFNSIQFVCAQDKKVLSEDELFSELIDAYIFINANELQYVDEHISVYYHNNMGMFTNKTYVNPDQELALKNTLALMKRTDKAVLIEETTFKEFDKDQLKALVLNYPEKDQLNFIYFNKEKSMGYHRAYNIEN